MEGLFVDAIPVGDKSCPLWDAHACVCKKTKGMCAIHTNPPPANCPLRGNGMVIKFVDDPAMIQRACFGKEYNPRSFCAECSVRVLCRKTFLESPDV